MNYRVAKILLTLGCAGMLTAAANAQLPTAYSAGDFVLGFRQIGTSTNSVVVDLGPINNFNTAQVFTINAGSTLSAQYGSGWGSDANVFFSLAATTSDTSRINYVTSPQYVSGPNAGPATVWSRLTTSDSRIFQNKINLFGSEFTSAGRIQPKTDPNAYSNYMPGGTNDAGHAQGNIAWGFFNPTSEGNFGQGTSNVLLDVIQLVPGNGLGADLGTFRISSDGNSLTYTPNAVPEPSTYAALALGALVLLGFRINKARRSSANQQAV